MKQLVICGGGSSAHTLIPLLKDSMFEVSIYTSKPEQWAKTIELEWHDPSGQVMGRYSGDLKTVSKKPQELIPQADYVVFCMPVHKYRACLHEIAPYLNKEKTVFVGTMYGQGGWNWMVDEIKEKYGLTNIITFAFGLIPWICRLIKKVLPTVAKPLTMQLVTQNSISNKLTKNSLNKSVIGGLTRALLSKVKIFFH